MSNVQSGVVTRFKPQPHSTRNSGNLGTVKFYRLNRTDSAEPDPDLAITGFAPSGKILIAVKFDGINATYRIMTRCNDLAVIKQTLAKYYKDAIESLAAN